MCVEYILFPLKASLAVAGEGEVSFIDIRDLCQYKDGLSMYGYFYHETRRRWDYNEYSYTGNTTYLYWDGSQAEHDDVIKWEHFLCYWPFVRGIHRWPVNSPHKCQSRGDLMFSLICVWINGWVNNREAGDLRRHRAHYDVIVIMDIHEGASLGWRTGSARMSHDNV